MTAGAVDVHALPAMLTALRLPSFHRHWVGLAERADKEGMFPRVHPARRPGETVPPSHYTSGHSA
jgi:hypothetical protein